jgi:hypothetical protein
LKRTGVANLPLHGGKPPRWLFKRMVKLSRGITDVLIYEFGKDEFLLRISDPFWFQALSCVLGFDYHSSGTTTVTCGALHEAIDPLLHGVAIAGGKGKASRKTPQQIEQIGEHFNFSSANIERMKYCSRMAAKVDTAALQDGHNLYHHVFLFSENGLWSVIQQGMNPETKYARRYHWLSSKVDSFTYEPHDAILGERQQSLVLDMTSHKSGNAQEICIDLVTGNPRHLKRDWALLTRSKEQRTLDGLYGPAEFKRPIEVLDMPRNINWDLIKEIYDFQPRNYEELISLRGVGPKTVRALALISDLIYGEKPYWNDPVKYSYTVGGKDGVPYPVDRKIMDESTEIIMAGVKQAKIGDREKLDAIKRLHNFFSIIS